MSRAKHVILTKKSKMPAVFEGFFNRICAGGRGAQILRGGVEVLGCGAVRIFRSCDINGCTKHDDSYVKIRWFIKKS